MPEESIMIDINNLTKIFNNVPAVKNLTLRVKEGEVFGFLGPNGAGKTTTIKAMLGLIYSNYGNVRIRNYDIHRYGKHIKKFIGYMPERVAFYENLTGLQNLEFYAELKNVPKNQCIQLINEMGLAEHTHKKVGNYSKGMVQRLGMARAILGNPPILILDEPTGGLDPRGVRLIRDKIKQMNEMGTTLFISSHILSEIQAICTQVGIIKKGTLVVQDTVTSLSKGMKVKPKLKLIFSNLNDKIIESIKKCKGVDKVETIGNAVEVYCYQENRADVVVAAYRAGGMITNIQTEEASLEDIFMEYTEEGQA